MSTRNDVLVWVDLEMTGLDPRDSVIVEMAMILTDRELEEIAPPWCSAIWQPDSVLDRMGPFVRQMHQQSGLLDQIRSSQKTVADAEREALAILSAHATFGTGRLCGNSVWQDRRFMLQYMPSFEQYLHYRQVDVSTLKELGSWWYDQSYPKPTDGQHTALFDIRQSIAELKFFRQAILK